MYYFSSSYTVYYPFERLYIGILNPYYNIYYTFNVPSPILHSFPSLHLLCTQNPVTYETVRASAHQASKNQEIKTIRRSNDYGFDFLIHLAALYTITFSITSLQIQPYSYLTSIWIYLQLLRSLSMSLLFMTQCI